MKNKIIIVLANYYPEIASELLKGAKKELAKNGYSSNNILIIKVPGVFEIPVMISKYIEKCKAVIALGCVIKGKTPHFEYISSSSINGIMYLSIKYKKPIGNGIITCLNKKQALDRADNKKINKGAEAAKAIIGVLK